MRLKVPSKRVREKFLLTYELEGCQRAVDLLTSYYGIRRIKIILNGRKVGNGYDAYYLENKAYFKKRGLNKRTVLHELYHHLVYSNNLDISEKIEEREANRFVRDFLRRKTGF